MKTHGVRVVGAFLAFVAAVTLASCGGSEEDSPTASCESVNARLRTCGLLSEGETSCDESPNEEEDCLANCAAGADCGELELLFCQGNETGTLETCFDRCRVFQCGNGAYIQTDDRCDGTPHCEDGADESGCAMFQCANGESVPENRRCDGDVDCNDGSDENVCPTFTCANGETVPEDAPCNGFPQCFDQSDELNCPMFACANGQEIPEQGRCDGPPQCVDQSDELGCPNRAEFICPAMP